MKATIGPSFSPAIEPSLPLPLCVMAARLEIALGEMLPGSSAWPAANKKPLSSGAFWEEEVVQLMMGCRRPPDVVTPSSHASTSAPALPWNAGACSLTLDLLGVASSARPPPPPPLPHLPPLVPAEDPESSSSCCFDLDADSPLPSGWEKCLDLQTGSIYYLNRSTGLSTSNDPRKALPSTLNNWPTSPSSSSDVTCEHNVPPSSSAGKPSLLLHPHDSSHLDLTLSLKPSFSCLRPNSLNHPLNHDLKSDLNPKLGNLISSQGALHHNQVFPLSVSSLPFNSTIPTSLPICTSSSTSMTPSSSPSTLFFQELSVLKEMGSVGSSMCVNQGFNGMSRYASNSPSVSIREKSTTREPQTAIHVSRSVSARVSKPTISDMPLTNGTTSPMMTVACANCLMFVMLRRSNSPRCPRCGASIDSDLPLPPPLKKPKLCFSLIN